MAALGIEIPTHSDQPQGSRVVVLDGAQFRIDLTWRERVSGWYLDLYAADDTPLALGRRLSSRWWPLAGLSVVGAPTGQIIVRGPDPYVRADLGAALRLVYRPLSTFPAAAADPDAPVIVIA